MGDRLLTPPLTHAVSVALRDLTWPHIPRKTLDIRQRSKPHFFSSSASAFPVGSISIVRSTSRFVQAHGSRRNQGEKKYKTDERHTRMLEAADDPHASAMQRGYLLMRLPGIQRMRDHGPFA